MSDSTDGGMWKCSKCGRHKMNMTAMWICYDCISKEGNLQHKLDETANNLKNILGVVMTGLPVDEFTQADWDKHRLYRIEGMVLRLLKQLEEE